MKSANTTPRHHQAHGINYESNITLSRLSSANLDNTRAPAALVDPPNRMDSPSAAARFAKNAANRDKKPRPIPNKLKIQQQRDKKKNRDKRRSASGISYLASTEGTTSDDGEEYNENVFEGTGSEHPPLKQQSSLVLGHSQPQQPGAGIPTRGVPATLKIQPHFSSKFSSLKGNKSPSDLDADDEDNQEYDSASMISQSDCLNLAAAAAGFQQHAFPSLTTAAKDGGDFEAQFQQISLAGMEQLKKPYPPSATSSNDDDQEEDSRQITSRSPSHRNDLLSKLSEKDAKILALERTVRDLSQKLQDKNLENERLKAENRKLVATKLPNAK